MLVFNGVKLPNGRELQDQPSEIGSVVSWVIDNIPSLYIYREGILSVVELSYQWYALLTTPGACWGNWHVLTEQAPIPGAQTWRPPLHIPYRYHISPCFAQYVIERYGCFCGIQKRFFWSYFMRMLMPFDWIGTILTKYWLALGEDSDVRQIPLFSPTCLQGRHIYHW